ncbi:hypothetical protein N0V82_004351 [Gnomoniopsis sp. IMI 355080]|nr:hypothetical protein N0V82_004351 [Gnomoniopsis sp. IMI 355080]
MDAPVDPVSPSLADFEYSMLTSRLQNLEQAQDPNHSLYQYSNQQIVKEIIKRHNQQNEMVRLSNIAQLEAQNRAAEAQFAGMPPLPPRLPPGPSSAWNTNIKQVAQFYQNCASGDLVSVKDFVETSSCDADTLDRGAESAAERNQVEVARFLFSKGVKLNSRIVSAALGRPDLKFFKLLVEEVGWHPNQALTNTGVALP